MTCRSGANYEGSWGVPTTMIALEGGSVGFKLGGQATDFVLLLMTKRSADNILTSKVKLGGDASAAAGPVGRNASAETDITLRAEILSYSAPAACLPAFRWLVRRYVPTTAPTKICTAKKSPPRTSIQSRRPHAALGKAAD